MRVPTWNVGTGMWLRQQGLAGGGTKELGIRVVTRRALCLVEGVGEALEALVDLGGIVVGDAEAQIIAQAALA